MPDGSGTGVTGQDRERLAVASRNVFATPEWLETWQRHDPSRAESFTLAARRPDRTVAALLPLTARDRGRFRPTVLRPVGPWPVPERPLICAPEDASWAVRDITAQLAARPGWDLLEMVAVPAEEPWREGLPGVTLSRQSSRVIELAGRSWDDLLGTVGRQRRKKIRRGAQRLGERYGVRFRLSDERSLTADVDRFLELHRMRWGDEVALLTPDRTAFVHDFAAQALQRGWLALWSLDLDGRTVAAKMNLRFAGREVAFMAGMDPAYRSDHVGMTLTYHAIREATVAGMVEYSFLRGDQPHKDQLPNRDRPVAHLLLSGSLTGRLATAARTARRGLRRAVRRARAIAR